MWTSNEANKLDHIPQLRVCLSGAPAPAAPAPAPPAAGAPAAGAPAAAKAKAGAGGGFSMAFEIRKTGQQTPNAKNYENHKIEKKCDGFGSLSMRFQVFGSFEGLRPGRPKCFGWSPVLAGLLELSQARRSIDLEMDRF